MVMGRNLADPRPFDLKKGKHTLRMWIREDGTMLDLFIITPKDNYPMNDTAAMDTTYATPVEPKGKLTVTWSSIKSGY